LKKQPLGTFLKGNFVGTVEEVMGRLFGLKEAGIEHFNLLHVPGDKLPARMDLSHQFLRMSCQSSREQIELLTYRLSVVYFFKWRMRHAL
jgi:hypothetical protein